VSTKRKLRDLINSAIPDRYFVTRCTTNRYGVVFTFDDGPHPDFTPASLDILDDLGVSATYFLVGRYAERQRNIVKDIVARGHLVGGHTYSHRSVAGLSVADLHKEVVDNGKRLSDLCGQEVKLFRPPWGRLDVKSACYLLYKGLQTVMWSIDSTDYKKSSASDIVAQVERVGLRTGDIILLHDDNDYTIEALPLLAAAVRQRGLDFSNLDAR
jgi:peptidoglycan/xylan/chitin deacetylase (PgdA/CDA1 family)